MRGVQTIDQVHVLPGDGWRGWNDQIKGIKVFDQVHVRAGEDGVG